MRTKAKFILFDRGISVGDAAKHCGVSYPYMSNVLNGKKSPSQKLQDNLSEMLGLPSDILFAPVNSISHLILAETGFNFKQKKLKLVEKPKRGDG